MKKMGGTGRTVHKYKQNQDLEGQVTREIGGEEKRGYDLFSFYLGTGQVVDMQGELGK